MTGVLLLYRLLVSVPLMVEYEAVLTREEHLQAAGVSNADMQDVLDALASVIEPVRLAYLWRPTLPDTLRVLKRAGAGNPPLAGDELPKKRAKTG